MFKEKFLKTRHLLLVLASITTTVFASDFTDIIGVCDHHHQLIRPDTDRPEASPKVREYYATRTIKHLRDTTEWQSIEQNDGTYRWNTLDLKYQIAKENGMSFLGFIGYSHRNHLLNESLERVHKNTKTPPKIEPLLDYARALVTRYKGQITHWQIWNEPNIGFWKGPKEDYAKMHIEVAKVIRETDPEAKIIFGATSGTDVTFIDMCDRAGIAPYVDVWVAHPYRNQPERLNEVELFVERIKRINKNAEIWFTEVGWSTGSAKARAVPVAPSTLEEQAAKTIKNFALLAPSGVKRIYLYDIINDGKNPDNTENNFGLLNYDGSRKPVANALAHMAETLRGYEYHGWVNLPDKQYYCYVFRNIKNGDYKALVWFHDHTGKQKSGQIKKSEIGTGKTSDIYGNGIEGDTLALTGSPLYVDGVFAKLAAEAKQNRAKLQVYWDGPDYSNATEGAVEFTSEMLANGVSALINRGGDGAMQLVQDGNLSYAASARTRNHMYMYFDIDDSFMYYVDGQYDVEIEFQFYPNKNEPGKFRILYDSTSGMKLSPYIDVPADPKAYEKQDESSLVSRKLLITDAAFINRWKYDFRIDLGKGNLHLKKLIVRKIPKTETP
ncbi:hypothetical protein OpiT1DRAFT_04840 [Opitutaceae bacterium TAV1]|nr:hypothetical protein OpiT1DRAFT_04840 [Opitutaceae bacterium TAV1]